MTFTASDDAFEMKIPPKLQFLGVRERMSNICVGEARLAGPLLRKCSLRRRNTGFDS